MIDAGAVFLARPQLRIRIQKFQPRRPQADIWNVRLSNEISDATTRLPREKSKRRPLHSSSITRPYRQPYFDVLEV